MHLESVKQKSLTLIKCSSYNAVKYMKGDYLWSIEISL